MLIANAQELILLVAGPKREVPCARIFGDPFPKNGDGSLQLKTAPSLAEARKWLGRTTCSAVLIDVKCAVRIPSKTLRNFRARAPEIPLIILCEKRDSARAAALVRSGAADYLVTTGLTPSAAQALIRRSIDLFQTRREIRRLKSQLKSGQDAMSQLQIQLVEAEKLDSLGQMAAGVAHEVKNPLAILQMGVEFFAQIPSSHPSQAKVLGKMKDAVHRADRIISDMVDFSRSNGLELALESVNASLRRAVNLTSHIWRHGTVEIVEELTAPLPPVRIDRSKIDQLFVNLIANAVHAMPAGGQITIRSYAGEISHLLQDEAPPHFAPLQIGDNVVVAEVRDFGSGIPEELLERVFDPFFTTKPTGKGTGLGLSVCRTIAHLHSGMLLIKNAVPSGVRAQLILPDATTTPPQSRRGKATP